MPWRGKIGLYPWHEGNAIRLLRSGSAFFEELIQQINASQKEIHFHVYIFEHDQTGTIVYHALCDALDRGVSLYLWLDAYGSRNFPDTWKTYLESKGAVVVFFSRFSIFNRYPLGIRLHHKIYLFDHQVALLGGINISNHYSHFGPHQPWLDFGVRAEGGVVRDLLGICLQVERRQSFRGLSVPIPTLTEAGTSRARVLENHWTRARFGISLRYRQRIRKANREIILIASYFLPSPALKRLLKKAARRGVRVQLVLSAKSDVGLMRYATQNFYEDLLSAGVEITEWEPSVLHAKVALIDEEWVCIGSYNLNYLSDFGSAECNLEVSEPAFHEHCLHTIHDLLNQGGKRVDPTEYHRRTSGWKRWRNALAYQLISWSFRVMFLLQKP